MISFWISVVQAHIGEYGPGPDDLLFPQWMFACVRSTPVLADDNENLPPLASKTGIVHEHGTMGARYAMNCRCRKCNAYGREYQRQWRHQQTAQRASNGELTKAYIWRRDGSEFLMADVWGRFWNAAREAAGPPEGFTAAGSVLVRDDTVATRGRPSGQLWWAVRP